MGSKTINRQGLYAKVEKYSDESITTLVDLMKNSKNDSIRVSAAKCLIDKCLPNAKEDYIQTENNESKQNYIKFLERERTDFS